MRTDTSGILIWVILVGLLVSFGVMNRQHQQFTSLVEANENSTNQLLVEVASLQAQIAETDNHLSRIEDAIITNGNQHASTAAIKIDLPDPGVYILSTEVFDKQNGTVRGVRIYHLYTIVGVDDFSSQLHMGVATAGLTSVPRIYIDYDGDGCVDMDMVREFAKPFFATFLGAERLLSDSIDADSAQATYSAFAKNSGDAEFITMDKIAEDGGKIAQQMWQFIDNQSQEMADWIRQKTEGEKTTAQ